MKTERLSESEFASRLYGRLVIVVLTSPAVAGLLSMTGLRGGSLILSTLVGMLMVGIGLLLWDRARLPLEDVADEVNLFGELLTVRRHRDVEKIRLRDVLCVETFRVSLSVQAYLCVRSPDGGSRRIRFTPRSQGRWHPYAEFACIGRLDRALADTDRRTPMSADAPDAPDADIPANVLALRGGTPLSDPVGLVLRNRGATGRVRAKEVYLRDDALFVEHPKGAEKVDLRDVIGYEIVYFQKNGGGGRGRGVPIPYRPLLDMSSAYSELELRLARSYGFGDRLRFRPDPRLYEVFGDLGGLVVAMARLASRARRIQGIP
jgi:hypothetical protein